jgi:tetratricopeptide (TPR) repeat protein
VIRILVALVAVSAVAYADPNAQAKAHFKQGRDYQEQGYYAKAAEEYKAAYELDRRPEMLFNIAQAYRLAGDCDESAWMYRRFLDTNPVGDHRTLAESHLASVEKCGSGGLRVTAPTPKQDALAVPEPATSVVTYSDPDRRSRTYKRVGLGTAIGGGALLAGAAIFAFDSYDASKTVAETYQHGGKWDDIKDVDARGKRSATIATVMGVGGGLAVVSGAVLFAVGRHYEQAQRVAVTPTAHGAQVSLSWGF